MTTPTLSLPKGSVSITGSRSRSLCRRAGQCFVTLGLFTLRPRWGSPGVDPSTAPSNAAPPATVNSPYHSPGYFRPGTTAALTPPDPTAAPTSTRHSTTSALPTTPTNEPPAEPDKMGDWDKPWQARGVPQV